MALPLAPRRPEAPPDAWREIATFLAITLALSTLFYTPLLSADTPRWNDVLSSMFMWCPGIAALASRWIHRRSFRGLGLGWARTRPYLLGVVGLPWLLALLVYLAIWLSGLGGFNPEPLAHAASRFGLGDAGGSTLRLAMIVLAVPAGAALGAPSTLGEELGWRGLLAPRLCQVTGFEKASLVTGFVWSIWHYPLVVILLPHDRADLPIWYALLCFTASVVGISFFYTWLRHRSGSVWPAVFLHASCNAAQGVFERLTADTTTTHYLTYEYGIGFTVVIWLCLAVSWKRLRADETNLRTPSLPRPAADG